MGRPPRAILGAAVLGGMLAGCAGSPPVAAATPTTFALTRLGVAP